MGIVMDDLEKLTEKPTYFAIIPAVVRYDKRLSPLAKLLYGEITCLLNFKNKCFASNKYFGRLYEITDVQVSRLIKQLIDANHIVTEVEITPKGSQRLIKLSININDNTPINKNVKEGVNKNVKHNKQIDNTIPLFENKDTGIDFFISEFNRIRKPKKDFTAIKIVKSQFHSRIKEGYKVCDLILVLQSLMKVKYHIENSFSDITPEFITRADKVEKYVNYKQSSEQQQKVKIKL